MNVLPKLLQVYRFDGYSTEVSISNTDVLYGTRIIDNEYEICLYSQSGHLVSSERILVKPFQVSNYKLNTAENKELLYPFGFFTLQKISGQTVGHFYTTFTHNKSGDTFVVHSHQLFFDRIVSTKIQRLRSHLVNKLRYIAKAGIFSMRKIAYPSFSCSLKRRVELLCYNQYPKADKLKLVIYANNGKTYRKSFKLNAYESKLICLPEVFKISKLDIDSIFVGSVYGMIGLKPLIFRYSDVGNLMALSHA
jgi:hypothetical protein